MQACMPWQPHGSVHGTCPANGGTRVTPEDFCLQDHGDPAPKISLAAVHAVLCQVTGKVMSRVIYHVIGPSMVKIYFGWKLCVSCS